MWLVSSTIVTIIFCETALHRVVMMVAKRIVPFAKHTLHRNNIMCADIDKKSDLLRPLKILIALKIWRSKAQIWGLEKLCGPSKF